MSAEAIDLLYREDGEALERVALAGGGEVAIAPDEEASGRNIAGEFLDVDVSPEGSVDAVSGKGGVRLDLPAAGRAPGRTIRAESLDARGEPGRGLTSAHFEGGVVFTEGVGQVPGREARSIELTASLESDGIADAVFRGDVSFEDGSLLAEASEIRYAPSTDSLRLATQPADGLSSATDEHIRIEARIIDLSIEGRRFNASGDVQTTVTSRGGAPAGAEPAAQRLPGLLREDEPARINADRLEYDSRSGRAVYAGRATLSQAETAIRGDIMTLDRRTGNLSVAGSARSTLLFGTGRFDGQADDIIYDDAARRVTYRMRSAGPTRGRSAEPPVPPAAPGGRSVVPPIPPRPARVLGPQGDLSAAQVELVLSAQSNELERLEAHTDVTMRVGTRTASGATLTFHTEDERYVIAGDGLTPVTIRDACRETTGRSLTFFRSSDRIVVDGNDTRRTETRPCTPQPAR
jgi:lipopolysaccharide export system protein LptA